MGKQPTKLKRDAKKKSGSERKNTAIWVFIYLSTLSDAHGQPIPEDYFANLIVDREDGIIAAITKGKQVSAHEKVVVGELKKRLRSI